MKLIRKPLRVNKTNGQRTKKAQSKTKFIDPMIAAEDLELSRLEKLLGIKKNGIVIFYSLPKKSLVLLLIVVLQGRSIRM